MLFIRGNFKNQFGPEGNYCQACLDINQPESQRHLYVCPMLSSSEVTSLSYPDSYNDLFGQDLKKQINVSRILKRRFEMRNNLIEKRPTQKQ